MTGAAPAGSTADVVADVIVVGGGIVGLATGAAVGDAGLVVALLAADRPGAASRAAAGLLVPHYGGEGATGAVERFMRGARDLYPTYVRSIAERSAVRIPFDASGAIELARSSAESVTLLAAAPDDAEPLTPRAIAELEPALGPTAGGVLYPRDGAVDNVRLTDALASIVTRHPRVRTVHEAAAAILPQRDSVTVVSEGARRIRGGRVVLAAGAWSGRIRGLPRPLPVRPIRGQVCVVRGAPLRHVVLTRDVYMVTRGGDRTLVGSTMEDVGFKPGTTPSAIDSMRRAAAAVCPALESQPPLDAWSGLRPATPDLLPILGPDPEHPSLIYACGHSRNGILLAPITAAVTASIVLGRTPEWDISPFAVGRFDERPVE